MFFHFFKIISITFLICFIFSNSNSNEDVKQLLYKVELSKQCNFFLYAQKFRELEIKIKNQLKKSQPEISNFKPVIRKIKPSDCTERLKKITLLEGQQFLEKEGKSFEIKSSNDFAGVVINQIFGNTNTKNLKTSSKNFDNKIFENNKMKKYSSYEICLFSNINSKWEKNQKTRFTKEAERRGLDCIFNKKLKIKKNNKNSFNYISDKNICNKATVFLNGNRVWENNVNFQNYVLEAKSRKLKCNINEKTMIIPNSTNNLNELAKTSNTKLCKLAINDGKWDQSYTFIKFVREAKKRGLSCGIINNEKKVFKESQGQPSCKGNYNPSTWTNCIGVYSFQNGSKYFGEWKKGRKEGNGTMEFVEGDRYVGKWKNDNFHGSGIYYYLREDNRKGEIFRGNYINGIKNGQGVYEYPNGNKYVGEFRDGKKHGKGTLYLNDGRLYKGIFKKDNFISGEVKNTKILLSNKKPGNSSTNMIDEDYKKPDIEIIEVLSKGKKGLIKGRVKKNITELIIDKKIAQFDKNGNFNYSVYLPIDGINVKIETIDKKGISNFLSVPIKRLKTDFNSPVTFEKLNPLIRKTLKNKDSLALIIGLENYEKTTAKAIYADRDAKLFVDYALEKLGVPQNKVKLLINNKADEEGFLLAFQDWLNRLIIPKKTDVFIFFAGHGLSSENGKEMYFLPYDGSPRLLKKTAILRKELFENIASANPKTVTVFLDTCYSGSTRGKEMLIASRPIAITPTKKSLPKGFTVFTAAAGDQTAKPLVEVQHGLFSYFLMKGMEGGADTNKDKKITAKELHKFIKKNVIKNSNGSQVPELQGDDDRIIIKFK